MIDKFLRESDLVNHLNNFSYSQLLIICYFKLLIKGNCGFILAFYVSRLSLRSKFNHSYVHCQFAFTTCLPISLSSFPDRLFQSFPIGVATATSSSPSSSSSAAAATTSSTWRKTTTTTARTTTKTTTNDKDKCGRRERGGGGRLQRGRQQLRRRQL